MKRIKALTIIAVLMMALIYLVPGCDELVTEVNNYTIAGHPIAEFNADKYDCCVPCTVTFDDNSQGTYQYGVFNFGDGTTDSESTFTPDSIGTVTHIYDSAGTYNVSLTVIDSTLPDTGRDSEYKSRYIIVGPLSAEFNADTTCGCPGTEVTFTPLETNGITKWNWDFGDGNDTVFDDSTPDTITHIYSSADTFEVIHTTTGTCGTTSEIDTIIIVDCLDPVCSLSVHEGCAPLSVNFRDMTSDSNATSRTWDFGDGGTSTEQDITYTFYASGVYQITLGVSENENSPYAYAYDTVIVYNSVTALFTVQGDSTSCDFPGRQFHVKFLDQSKGNIQNLIWDFGDGDTLHNDTNPIHAYIDPGIYSVSLTATGLCGEDTIIDTLTDTALVVLSDTLYEETSGFKILPNDTVSDIATEFTFTDTSIGVIEERKWTLNSDEVEDSVEINYIFDDAGSYEVTLEISNCCGDTIEVSRTVVIDTTSEE